MNIYNKKDFKKIFFW